MDNAFLTIFIEKNAYEKTFNYFYYSIDNAIFRFL